MEIETPLGETTRIENNLHLTMDEDAASFHSLHPSLSTASTTVSSRGKHCSSYVLVNRKLWWSPPVQVLHSIADYLPKTPLSLVIATPRMRAVAERHFGYSLDEFGVSPADDWLYAGNTASAMTVEEDYCYEKDSSPTGASAADDNNSEGGGDVYYLSPMACIINNVNSWRASSSCCTHRYPLVGYRARAGGATVAGTTAAAPVGGSAGAPGFLQGVNAHGGLVTSMTTVGDSAAGGDQQRVSALPAPILSQSTTIASVEASMAAMEESCCWKGTEAELSMCLSVRVASTPALRAVLSGSWWYSRYFGVRLTLEGMKQEQLSAFIEVSQRVPITELRFVRCVLTAEWMQTISMLDTLLSLTLHSCSCAPDSDVSLLPVHPILSNRAAVETTSSSFKALYNSLISSVSNPLAVGSSASATSHQRQQHHQHSAQPEPSTWYLSGARFLGRAKGLRCLHIYRTPLTPRFLDCLPQCAALECVLLCRSNGVSSLASLPGLPQLRSVTAIGLSIDDDGAKALGECGRLQQLVLEECRNLTHVHFLRSLAQTLRRLSLRRCWLTDGSLEDVAACFNLEELNVEALRQLTTTAPLANLTNLIAANLSGNVITNEGARPLQDLVSLRFLDLSACRCLSSLDTCARALGPRLVSLDLSGSSIDAAGIAKLRNCKTLRYLDLSECKAVSSIAFAAEMPATLRWLSLAGTWVTDADLMQSLCAQHHLRFLSLAECARVSTTAFVEAAVGNTRGMRSLAFIDLQGTAVTDAGVAPLAQCGELSYVGLARCRFLTSVEVLGTLTRLRHLDISHTYITNAGVECLGCLPALEVLHMRGCARVTQLSMLLGSLSLKEVLADYMFFSTTDAIPSMLSGGWEKAGTEVWLPRAASTALARPQSSLLPAPPAIQCGARSSRAMIFLPSLQPEHQNNRNKHPTVAAVSTVESRGVRFSLLPRTVDRRISAHYETVSPVDCNSRAITGLLCLSLRKSTITEALLNSIAGACRSLARLDLSDCVNLTEARGLSHLTKLAQLSVANSGINNSGVMFISYCVSLEKLALSGCVNVTNVNPLGALRHLRELDLSRTSVTSEGTTGLARCVSLRWLSLKECRYVTDINHLGALDHLRDLHVESTHITDAGVAQLSRCIALERVYFTKCRQIVEAGWLASALPQLEVFDVYGTSIPTRVAGQPQQRACVMF